VDSHCLSLQGAECDLCNNDNSEVNFCVKCEDNSAEADSLTRSPVGNDTAASLEMKVNSVEETLLTSPLPMHPKQESTDPRSLQEADLARLIEQNANIDRAQKERVFQVLIKYLEYDCPTWKMQFI
jgi:hypothetical protein